MLSLPAIIIALLVEKIAERCDDVDAVAIIISLLGEKITERCDDVDAGWCRNEAF